ncbi:MAG: glutaredoxin 3 [Deltaproteobacteria bacterium]|nr:glutaredoxin 3 [Deltaproteobacteria bacterium]
MTRVKLYTTTYCHYCKSAKALLNSKGIAFEEIDVTEDDKTREWLVNETGLKTVPQIFIDGKSIGGFDNLSKLNEEGKIDHLKAPI